MTFEHFCSTVPGKVLRWQANPFQTIRTRSWWIFCRIPWTIKVDWVKVLCPTQHKIGYFGDIPKPISWLRMEKVNLTELKHTLTNQKKRTTTQNKHKKLQPNLVTSYDIQPWNGDSLVWFRRFINLSLTYLLKHLAAYLQPHTGLQLTQWPQFNGQLAIFQVNLG